MARSDSPYLTADRKSKVLTLSFFGSTSCHTLSDPSNTFSYILSFISQLFNISSLDTELEDTLSADGISQKRNIRSFRGLPSRYVRYRMGNDNQSCDDVCHTRGMRCFASKSLLHPLQIPSSIRSKTICDYCDTIDPLDSLSSLTPYMKGNRCSISDAPRTSCSGQAEGIRRLCPCLVDSPAVANYRNYFKQNRVTLE
jgi:hypothetical protein